MTQPLFQAGKIIVRMIKSIWTFHWNERHFPSSKTCLSTQKKYAKNVRQTSHMFCFSRIWQKCDFFFHVSPVMRIYFTKLTSHISPQICLSFSICLNLFVHILFFPMSWLTFSYSQVIIKSYWPVTLLKLQETMQLDPRTEVERKKQCNCLIW